MDRIDKEPAELRMERERIDILSAAVDRLTEDVSRVKIALTQLANGVRPLQMVGRIPYDTGQPEQGYIPVVRGDW